MMRRTLKVIVGFAVAGMIAVAPAAEATSMGSRAKTSQSASVTRAGTSYIAATTYGVVALVVSRDRRRVRGVLFAYRLLCSDGTVFATYDVHTGIPIAADRTFRASYDSGPQTDPASPGVTSRTTTSISGVLNKRGSKIVGTARDTATTVKDGVAVTCDTGLVQFRATH
jgi:hypothetical protein